MFTGIVSGLGLVTESSRGRIGVEHQPTAARAVVGASVAVNGACLTVVEIGGAVFYADVVPETLKRTNLGGLKPGDEVNLELPLTPEQLLDGHLVQGHVDATASVRAVRQVELGREVTIELPVELARLVAEKGSIAVDGVSLTLVDVEADRFSVALIPHTLQATTLGQLPLGGRVNLETDLLAKYAQKQALNAP